MSTQHVQIKDILIQGSKGHRISRLVSSTTDPMQLTKDEIKTSYESGYSIVKYGNMFYQVNPNIEPSIFLIEDKVENNSYREKLMHYFGGNETYVNDLGIVQSEPSNRLLPIFNLIESIASRTLEHKTPSSIARAITDEFTFYPSNTPFTLDEYKEIINKVFEIISDFPPDIHLVLATFPVLWPDGGVHNCGLYVQSPTSPDKSALLHHFSKKNHHSGDPLYQKPDGTTYYLNKADSDNPDYSPNMLLSDTKVSTNDVNQHESAINVARSDGKEFIVSLGICFDHGKGVEREQVHQLISQLQSTGKEVPLLCSHVITSASIGRNDKYTLSTVSHADTKAINRRPLQNQIPGRSGFDPSTISCSFSGELGAEIYSEKLIGTMHSDLFQHAIASQFPHLNECDQDGNTMLHHVFLESEFDRELIARRLYIMIVNGGDPYLRNAQNETVFDLAAKADKARADKIISKAIGSALEWREHYILQNQTSAVDGFNKLTRAIRMNAPDIDYDFIRRLILSGSNPYLKDDFGKSAIELIDENVSEDKKKMIKEQIDTALMYAQYGYIRDGVKPEKLMLLENGGYVFPGYIPESANAIELYNNGYAQSFDLGSFDKAIKLYPTSLDSEVMRQIRYSDILSAFYIFSQLVYVPNQAKKLLYDTTRFRLLKEGIELPAIDENQSESELINHLSKAMISAFFSQWKNKLREKILTGKDLFDLLAYLSEEDCIAAFELVKDKIREMVQRTNDLIFLYKISQEERSIVFELIQDKLPEMIQSLNDLKLIQHFLPNERTVVFELVKDKIPAMLENPKDLEFIKYLSREERSSVFELVKDILPDRVRHPEDLMILEYLLQEERSTVFELVKDKLVNDILMNNFSSSLNYMQYFLSEEVAEIFELISEESWDNIRDTFDGSCDVCVCDLSQHPKAFLVVFEKMQLTFLSETAIDHKSYILNALSQRSPEFLSSIKENILPKLIQSYSLRGLNKPQLIKALILKTYPADSYDEFQLFLSKLDVKHRDVVINCVKDDLNVMFKIGIPPASIKMKKDLQHLTQRRSKAPQESLVVDNKLKPMG